MSIGKLLDPMMPTTRHFYVLTATGLKKRNKLIVKEFNSRPEAEAFMHKLCEKYGVSLVCTEDDKHEKKYSNHRGVRVYINRQ